MTYDFGEGDYITIICHDDKEFTGVVDYISPQIVSLRGILTPLGVATLGFPVEDIKDWAQHG